MRNTKKWLVLLLTIVMLVGTMATPAMAEESWASLDLEVTPAGEGGILQADILTWEGQNIADGKLVLTYDPAVLTFVSAEPSTAWANAEDVTLSVNDAEGKLILAFASAEAAQKEGVLFRIRFSGFVGDVRLGLVGRDSYIGSSKVPAIGGEFCPSDQFVDMRNMLPQIHEAVDYMVGMGYMNGMSASHFGPNTELNRAMMVTILHRIAGSPEATGTHSFVDVPDGQFYSEPVLWALEKGVTTGLDDTHFAPGKSLTRQELVTFLYRFAGVMGYDTTATTDLSAYTDAAKVQPYAIEPFQWAVAAGVVNGTSATTLSPEATTTRAQICIMVSRLLTAQD